MTPITINDPEYANCDTLPPLESLKALFGDDWAPHEGKAPADVPAVQRFKCGLEDQHRGAHIVVLESGETITQVAWWAKTKPPRRSRLLSAAGPTAPLVSPLSDEGEGA